MSIEFDSPTNLNEMHQIAQDWVKNRPTLRHTKNSLRLILTNELDELQNSVANHLGHDAILMETGDVFFSMLAFDTDNSGRFDRDYMFFSRYMESLGSDLVSLFKATYYKNRVHYPITFFNKMSPFILGSDAVSCLRILRAANNNSPKQLDIVWLELDQLINDLQPCFFDRTHSNNIFREFIKNKLLGIKSANVNSKTKKEINRLIKVGFWEYSDLNLPDSRFNWYRITE